MSERSVLLLVGSPKGMSSTSYFLGRYFINRLKERGFADRVIAVGSALRKDEDWDELVSEFDRASVVVLSTPLFVDSLPTGTIKALGMLAEHRKVAPTNDGKRFAAVVNCGFPEAHQCDTALAICRRFAVAAGMEWAGGLALGGGPMLAGKPLDDAGGPAIKVKKALEIAAEDIATGRAISDEARKLMAAPSIPHWAYSLMANLSMYTEARKHGAVRRLNARPYEE